MPNDSNQNSYPITGYQAHHIKDVSVYYKLSLHVTILELNIPQTATIAIEVHDNEQKNHPIHTILNIYRRPRKKHNFSNDMQTALDTILTKSPETSITIQGDININLLTLNNTNPLYSFLLENNLTTTITTPTRQDPHHKTSTLIDVILTTLNETKVTSGTLSPPLSDHLQTYAIFYSKPERQKQTKRKTLSRRQYERQKDAIITNATTALTQLRPNISTERRIREMQQTLQKTIEQYERFAKRRRKPWCSPKLASQIRKQHQLHQRKLAHPTPANIKKHKEFRHNLNKLIKHQKKQHIQSELEKYQKDHKQQAKILKTIIPSRSKPRTSPTEIIYEAKTHTDPQHIANALNDFFITIGHKTSETIPMNLTEEQIRPETSTTPTFQQSSRHLQNFTRPTKRPHRNNRTNPHRYIQPSNLRTILPGRTESDESD